MKGIILAGGYAGYVFAMYNTTVTNANFIIQTQTIFLALFGYIFLREKISKLTLISIILAKWYHIDARWIANSRANDW